MLVENGLLLKKVGTKDPTEKAPLPSREEVSLP